MWIKEWMDRLWMDGWMEVEINGWIHLFQAHYPLSPFSRQITHIQTHKTCPTTHTHINAIHTHQCDPHMHTHTHSLIKLFPTLWPPAGVMNFRRFPKCLPTFLFELYTHLASSCCTHSHSYKHSITNTHTHTRFPPLHSP